VGRLARRGLTAFADAGPAGFTVRVVVVRLGTGLPRILAHSISRADRHTHPGWPVQGSTIPAHTVVTALTVPVHRHGRSTQMRGTAMMIETLESREFCSVSPLVSTNVAPVVGATPTKLVVVEPTSNPRPAPPNVVIAIIAILIG
jgi:hypothetical protein